MIDLTHNVNWLAVGVGAILAHGFGWIWYSPRVFGLKWAAAVGVEYNPKPPLAPIALQFFGTLLMSWFVGIMAREGLLPTMLLMILALFLIDYAVETYADFATDVKLVNGGYWLLFILVLILTHALI